jgi:hypothetical protein
VGLSRQGGTRDPKYRDFAVASESWKLPLLAFAGSRLQFPRPKSSSSRTFGGERRFAPRLLFLGC